MRFSAFQILSLIVLVSMWPFQAHPEDHRFTDDAATSSVWFGSPAADARRALMTEALSGAASHGLDILESRRAPAGTPLEAQFHARVLEYISALGQGFVSRNALGPGWTIPEEQVAAAALLEQAVRDDALAKLVDTLRPVDPQYSRLMAALARYRAMDAQGGWSTLGANVAAYQMSPADAEALRARLAAEGYIIQSDRDLGTAVRVFQFTHDLDVDGRIGPQTLAALNVPAYTRVAQLAANLERWRHLPRRAEARRIVVNIPAAQLDVMNGNQSVVRMRVINGDPAHPTPSFVARISAVTFNPVWNVPSSIARKEILPRVKRRPAYLAEHNIIIIDRPDDPFGKDIAWRNYREGYFPFQLRQLLGPNNSLGTVKFEMPNPFDVYLHDTPSRSLFARAGRALSHGCVRLENPAELADLMLDGHGPPDIAAEINAGVTRTIKLAAPMPVYIYYLTASADPSGEVHFHSDIYAQDPALIDALGISGYRAAGPTAQAKISDVCG